MGIGSTPWIKLSNIGGDGGGGVTGAGGRGGAGVEWWCGTTIGLGVECLK